MNFSTPLRIVALGLAAYIGLSAYAQPTPPYSVQIYVEVPGCTPGSSVNVQTASNTLPVVNVDVPLDPTWCYMILDLEMESLQGAFLLSTPCNGSVQNAQLSYAVDLLNWSDTTYISATLDCQGTGPCTLNPCFNVASNTPWAIELTNCTSGAPPPYSCAWVFSNGSISADCNPTLNLTVPGSYWACLSVTDANGCTADTCSYFLVDPTGNINNNWIPCQACVEAVPALDGPAGNPIPWTVEAINCSTNGAAPVTYIITWGDGVTGGNNPHVYAQPGQYDVCIQMTDVNGCTSSACDSVLVAADGTIDPINPGECTAGYWVMQAYTVIDPNGTVGEPIPNELWIWNLSSGGTGNYQFLWSFGDGTSSTEAFPTHIYANGGPYELCLTMWDGANCTDTYCDSVSVDENGMYEGMIIDDEADGSEARQDGFTIRVLNQLPTGIPDRPVAENMAVWPNPVDDQLNLTFNTTAHGSMPMSIIDLNGRVTYASNVLIATGANRLEIPVSELAQGMYLLRFGNNEKAVSFRFVKR